MRLTRLLVQGRFKPVSMDKQILFLYAALKGFLDWLPVELVSTFEEEFYTFYESDVSFLPLKSNLDFKDNSIDNDVVSFLFWNFTAAFVNFAVKGHNFQLS